MEQKFVIAKGVFVKNPKIKEVFVINDGNVFLEESRALKYAEEHPDTEFLGAVTRDSLKQAVIKAYADVINVAETALIEANNAVPEKEAAQQLAVDEYNKAQFANREAEKITAAAKEAAAKATTDTEKKALQKELEKAEKEQLAAYTAEQKAKDAVGNAQKALNAALKQVEKLTTAVDEAKAAVADFE